MGFVWSSKRGDAKGMERKSNLLLRKALSKYPWYSFFFLRKLFSFCLLKYFFWKLFEQNEILVMWRKREAAQAEEQHVCFLFSQKVFSFSRGMSSHFVL